MITLNVQKAQVGQSHTKAKQVGFGTVFNEKVQNACFEDPAKVNPETRNLMKEIKTDKFGENVELDIAFRQDIADRSFSGYTSPVTQFRPYFTVSDKRYPDVPPQKGKYYEYSYSDHSDYGPSRLCNRLYVDGEQIGIANEVLDVKNCLRRDLLNEKLRDFIDNDLEKICTKISEKHNDNEQNEITNEKNRKEQEETEQRNEVEKVQATAEFNEIFSRY